MDITRIKHDIQETPLPPIRVLLINAINPDVEVETRYPHLGLGYLVSYARKTISDTEIIFKIIDQDIEKVTEEFRPDLAGITSVTQNFNIAIQYINYLHSKAIPVILGGIHITSLPDSLPQNVVAASIGEGEVTFTELLRAFMSKQFDLENIKTIKGLIYWENGSIKRTPNRDFMMEMDQIPFPARDLLLVHPHTYMFTSRGCPYKCTFCASSKFWNKVRFFSAEYVVNEIAMLYERYNVTMISFFDDLFIASLPRLKEIYAGLAKKGLIGKIRFTCSCRANLVTRDLAKILAQMGVVSVGLGLESGNDEILKYLKGCVTVENNYAAINNLKEEKIFVNGSFVIGSPHETESQIMDTYRFIKKSRLDLFDVYILTPYPGTETWGLALKKGFVSVGMDWTRLNVNAYRNFDQLIILSEVINSQRLKALYMKFRRLRLIRNFIKVINHPMRKDIPVMAIKLMREYLTLVLKRLRKTDPSPEKKADR